MTVNENDWREEQRRADKVTGLIRRGIEQLEREIGVVHEESSDIRKHFWDDVTVNFSHSDDVEEAFRSLKQQADILSERERSHRHAAASLDKLRRLVKTPYFGRIDFTENGGGPTEQIYLGIGSFLDEDEVTFLVYDWRAPISSLYYDYAPGPASYETPIGKVSGTMELKRQYVIRDGVIELMFDTGMTIGDKLLQEVLSRTSDAQMRSIVATIQQEQNRIIRNDRSRMLIVQGAAGSGKTSAALQRVAYLLYKNRETLQADQMVLFSPNPMFNSYVSTVLPELGEENMQQTTFQEYLERRLGREFQLEDPFEQLEYVLSGADEPGYEGRLSGIAFKSSPAYLQALLTYRDMLEQDGMLFKPLKFRGREVVSAEQMREKFYAFEPSIRLTNRLVLMRDWLLKEVAAFEKIERKKAWVEDAMNLLDNEDYQRAYKLVRRKQQEAGDTFDDFELEQTALARMIVSDKLKPLRRRIKLLRFADAGALYRQLFDSEGLLARITGQHQLPEHWPAICGQTVERLDRLELAYEDATPYLFLTELLQGFQTYPSVKHVLVDEAQDYSPFQLEFLKRLFPRCRMTALGDLNQAIYAHASALGELDPIAGLYGREQTEVIRLTRSYRSTREIVEFTRGMVPGGEAIVPFNRGGVKPQVAVSAGRAGLNAAVAADVQALRAEGFASIAVICKTAGESAAAYEALRGLLEGGEAPAGDGAEGCRAPRRRGEPDRAGAGTGPGTGQPALGLVTKHTPEFEKGTLVIPAYLAKGVEFDAVLIYDGSREQYSRESERKLFYTACTRAMHLLRIHSLGEPSPFVTDQPADTYTVD